MTAPRIEITDGGSIYYAKHHVGDIYTGEAAAAIRAALAELEALRPAPPEDVPITQLKGRTIDGETEPVDWWVVNAEGASWWSGSDGEPHNFTVDPATATVLCRPLDAEA